MVKWVVISCVGAMIFLSACVGAGLYLRSDSIHDNCEGVNEVRTALQVILTRSQGLAAQNEEYTIAEKLVAKEFYARAIHDLEPTKC